MPTLNILFALLGTALAQDPSSEQDQIRKLRGFDVEMSAPLGALFMEDAPALGQALGALDLGLSRDDDGHLTVKVAGGIDAGLPVTAPLYDQAPKGDAPPSSGAGDSALGDLLGGLDVPDGWDPFSSGGGTSAGVGGPPPADLYAPESTEPSSAHVPSAPASPQLSGIWSSNIGLVYQVSQHGAGFTWTVLGHDEQAVGFITPEGDLMASWQGSISKGQGGARFVAAGGGKPAQVIWDNGVVFTQAR